MCSLRGRKSAHSVGRRNILLLRQRDWTSHAISKFEAMYVKALVDLDFPDLTKNYEVEADDIVALREAGLTDLTVEQLISLKEHGE